MSLRLLHTADWHLGQTFHGYDRDFEHGRFLDWLITTLVEQKPDALVVSGDIFDTVNPSSQAQRRFYDFLARAHAVLPSLQIVITAGNHDAAARLEAPSGLLESLNITVVGTLPRCPAGTFSPDRLIVLLKNASGTVEALVLAVPFLRHADLPTLADGQDAYLDGIKEIYRLATQRALELRDSKHPGAALVALAHCHLAGGLESRDSERRIVIGGSESLRADTLPTEIAYVAMGHLHKPQAFDGDRLCYSGSPIPLSFSEQDYTHRVVLVTLAEGRLVATDSISIPKSASLMRLPPHGAAKLPDLLTLIGTTAFDVNLPPEQHPFLEVNILDDGPDPTRRHQIETALAGRPVRLATIKLTAPARTATDTLTAAVAPTLADLTSLDPVSLLTDAYRERYQAEPDPELLNALNEILAAEIAETSAPASA